MVEGGAVNNSQTSLWLAHFVPIERKKVSSEEMVKTVKRTSSNWEKQRGVVTKSDEGANEAHSCRV